MCNCEWYYLVPEVAPDVTDSHNVRDRHSMRKWALFHLPTSVSRVLILECFSHFLNVSEIGVGCVENVERETREDAM